MAAEVLMPRIPGGPLAARPLHFVFIADCSGSMANDKIQSLNHAIRESIPHMREVARANPNAEVMVRAVKFSTGAQWHHAQPTSVHQFEWDDVSADGETHMGRALALVAESLKREVMPERALPPVLVLVSDGAPTDDFEGGLRALMAEPWGKKAVRIAVAIGRDAETNALQKFIGNAEVQPLQANNADQLVKYIRWASTVVLQAASSPATQTAAAGALGPVPIPAQPDPGPVDPNDVW